MSLREIGSRGMQKRAAGLGPWSQFAVATGAAIAAPLAIAGINKVIGSVQESIGHGRRFSSMMQANPDLKDLDRVKVQRAFNTINRFAPSLASDPTVAGTFVKRTADYDMIDHKTIGELARAEKDLSGISRGPLAMETSLLGPAGRAAGGGGGRKP